MRYRNMQHDLDRGCVVPPVDAGGRMDYVVREALESTFTAGIHQLGYLFFTCLSLAANFIHLRPTRPE